MKRLVVAVYEDDAGEGAMAVEYTDVSGQTWTLDFCMIGESFPLPDRLKHTSLVDGITGLVIARNYICSLGPGNDPDREILVIKAVMHRG